MNKIKLLVLGLASLFVGFRGVTSYGLANEASATTRSAQHWKRKTAIAIGKPDMAEGDDEALEAAHDAHMQMANEFASMPEGPGEVTGAENEQQTAEQLEQAEKDRKTALANEEVAAARKETSDLLIANALKEGRILPAEKTGWEGKFANEFEATKTALANEKVKIKTKPRTLDLGNENSVAESTEQERRQAIEALVNEEMPKHNGDYQKAWDSVRANPKNKPLFNAMKKPETAQS